MKTKISASSVFRVILCCGFLLFVSSFCGETACAQDNLLRIKGIVQDSEQNPIENAHIVNLSSGYRYNAISKSDGAFQIVAAPNDTMAVSCMGFELFTFTVDKTLANKLFRITLKPEMLELATFVVSDRKVVKVYQDEKYYALDFLLNEQGIILLGANYINKKYFLRQYNYGHEKTAELFLDFKPQDSMFQDYLGRMFLFDQKDRCYQFWRNKNGFELEEVEVNRKLLLEKMDALHFRLNEKDFHTIYNHPVFPYIGLVGFHNRESGALPVIKTIYSEEVLRSLYDDFWGDYFLIMRAFLEPISVYAPLFKIPDKIVLFDHVNDEIDILNDSLKLLQTVEMESLKPSRKKSLNVKENFVFTRKIFQDGDRFYALFKSGGGKYYQLKEIDYQTGKIGKAFILEQPFPRRIKVKNGCAYYLYRDPGSADKWGLFMQPLR